MKEPTEKQRKKFAKYLASGEEIVAIFGINDRFFWGNFLPLIPLSILLIGMPFLYKLFHLRHGRKYILTTRRVLVRKGILTTELTSAPYTHITRITVREPFLYKIGYQMGDVIIQTTGPTPVEIHLVNVSEPLKVKNLIEELIIKEKTLPHGGQVNYPLVKPF